MEREYYKIKCPSETIAKSEAKWIGDSGAFYEAKCVGGILYLKELVRDYNHTALNTILDLTSGERVGVKHPEEIKNMFDIK